MKVYSIAQMTVRDPSWVDAYAEHVTPMVARYGGRFLARTDRVVKLEGDAVPQVVVIVEWPSREAADRFYASDDYRPWREARVAGSADTLIFLVPGHDVTGRAQIS
jgi:uncharacterized protein (DUF1330 family)